MSVIGSIKQYRGPFNPEDIIEINGHCIIGFSTSEDDYMEWGSRLDEHGQIIQKSIPIQIKVQKGNSQQQFQIWLGRTCMYQTQHQVDNITQIIFPQGAPSSTLIEVVYCSATPKEIKEIEGEDG